jgi:hypothetical protein
MTPLFPELCLELLTKPNCGLPASKVGAFASIVFDIFHSAEDWTVQALCLDFFCRYSQDYLAELVEVLMQLISLWPITVPKFAKSAFDALHIVNPGDTTNTVLLFRSFLDPLAQNNFAAMVSRDITEYRSLWADFPFLTLGSRDEEQALNWFSTNPLRLWPMASPTFLSQFKLFVEEHRIEISDLSDASLLQLRFIIENRNLFDIPTLHSFISANRNRLKTLIIEPSGTAPFLFTEVDESIPRLATITPLLRRGQFILSPSLFKSFFLFSQVKINPDFFDEIKAQFHEDPVLFKLSEDYIRRVLTDRTLKAENMSDICSLFCPKTSFLRQMLIDADSDRLSPTEVNLLMLICFSHLDELEKPSKLFYFFRFLRVCVSKIEQAQLQGLHWNIRNDWTFIAEHLSPILEPELALFYPSQRTPYLEYLRTERLPKMEIPSWLMAQLKSYPRNGVSFGTFERSVANPIFAVRFLDAVSAHREWISQLEFYAELLFDERSPLLSVVDASFLSTLLAHHHETQRLAKFMERLRSAYFSIPDGIKFITQFYGQKAPSLVVSYCIENFATNLSLASAKLFVEFLVTGVPESDAVELIENQLTNMTSGCFWVLVIAKLFMKAKAGNARPLFVESRRRAFALFRDGDFDAAFEAALADTNEVG